MSGPAPKNTVFAEILSYCEVPWDQGEFLPNYRNVTMRGRHKEEGRYRKLETVSGVHGSLDGGSGQGGIVQTAWATRLTVWERLVLKWFWLQSRAHSCLSKRA